MITSVALVLIFRSLLAFYTGQLLVEAAIVLIIFALVLRKSSRFKLPAAFLGVAREAFKYGFPLAISGIAILVFTVAMVLYFINDPAIVMKDNKFEIRGPEGIKVHLDDFKAITIENFIPKIVDMYDGRHIGETYRGKFELYRTGTSLLYVDRLKSPYIFIFLKSDIGLVITRDNPEEARQLYEDIRTYWNHYLSTDVIEKLKKRYPK